MGDNGTERTDEDGAPTAVEEGTEKVRRSARPRGRIRGGATVSTHESHAARPRAVQVSIAPERLWSLLPWALVVVAAAIAIGLGAWAFSLRGQVHDQANQIQQQAGLIAGLRSRSNATAWDLARSPQAPPLARGLLMFALQPRTAMLSVQGLTGAKTGQAYQVWYLKNSKPEPGPVFHVNDKGQAVVAIPLDISLYNGITITTEPVAGSKQPTSPILLSAQITGAAG